MTKISVVIPVYRSANTLPELTLRLNRVLQTLDQAYEIILVNDGSPDESWEKIKELQKQNSVITGIHLMRNYGQHSALAAGIREARGHLIVTLDDDLQTPPEELPKLLNKLEEGFDLVYGVRSAEKHGTFRNCCSRLGKLLLARLLGVPVATSISSYKAFRSELRELLVRHEGPVVFLDALLCYGTTRIGTVVVEHRVRPNGVSGYSFSKLIRHYANMTTSFSQFPLKLASLIGIVTMLMGLALFIFVLVVYWTKGVPVPGFTFVAASITLFSGIQFFILGIMGEYLARMHQNLIGMPPYVVREAVGSVLSSKLGKPLDKNS